MQRIRNRFLKVIEQTRAWDLPTVMFGMAWRAAILTLPWQTRWYHEANLAGWPWEQGSAAFYVSWPPMIVAIVAGFVLRNQASRRVEKRVLFSVVGLMAVSAAALAYTPFMQAESAHAVVQWWLQIVLLAAFCVTLWRNDVKRRSVVSWIIVAILPQIFLVFYQYAIQHVNGSSWLGMATHTPKQPGTSVVEFGEYRYLRAYGGMPHPNIMGGWLTMGVLLAIWSAWQAKGKRLALAFTTAAALFAGALVMTFSRSAFLALAVGLVASLVQFFVNRKRQEGSVQFGVIAVVCALVFAAVIGFSQREVLLARTQGQNRLEAKSVDARQLSMDDGWSVFRHRPVLGTGPNAELAEVWQVRRSISDNEPDKSPEPLESPHNTALLFLIDFGCLGSAILLYLLYIGRRSCFRALQFLLPLAVLLWFDHYAWSYWSGQTLLALVLAAALMSERADAELGEAVPVDALVSLD